MTPLNNMSVHNLILKENLIIHFQIKLNSILNNPFYNPHFTRES